MTTYSPDFFYHYNFDTFNWDAIEPELTWLVTVLMQIGLILGVLALVAFLVFYVFSSLSIYTMADRRGFSGAFLAWIPLVRWGMLGRVASDVHQARTGARAFYGTALAFLALFPAAVSVYGFFAEVGGWLFFIVSLLAGVQSFVMLFALSEVYRDYSRRWVGMLIFAGAMPFLRPIFLLAIHKNVPASVHTPGYAPQGTSGFAAQEPQTPPAQPQPIVTPPPAPQPPVQETPEAPETPETPADPAQDRPAE